MAEKAHENCVQANKNPQERIFLRVSEAYPGAAGRNRTGDLRITNALLYQLSYSGKLASDYK
jgi:hypothetical protein